MAGLPASCYTLPLRLPLAVSVHCLCVHVSVCLCVCVLLRLCSCDDKFVQERGVARLWEVAGFDVLLPRN